MESRSDICISLIQNQSGKTSPVAAILQRLADGCDAAELTAPSTSVSVQLMGELKTISLEESVLSYAHWWREAGLDCATDDLPHNWREAQAVPFWRREPSATAAAIPVVAAPAPQMRQAKAAPAGAPARPKSSEMPGTLPAFLDWLVQDESHPEAEWEGTLITPPALEQPRLLLIVDMPAADADNGNDPLDPGQRRFVQSMLASLGVAAQDAPCFSLAMRRPTGGVLEEDATARLGERMKHYLGLVRPASVILLGDRTGRAIIGRDWRPGSASLQRVDHRDGTMDIVTLAGPDLLMGRPAAKARSWQALRLLHGKLN